MRNDTFYTNTIVRKKRGENDVTSGHVTSVHVTSISQYFGGSKGERAIAYALLEVTSPEAALTGNDVT
jgi:hypothetical protein